MTMAKPKYPYSVLINTKRNSFGNWGELHRSLLCGCYHCGTIFLSKDVYDWIGLDARDADSATAICPFCGVNAVIPDSSAYPLNKDFLEYMRLYCDQEEKKT